MTNLRVVVFNGRNGAGGISVSGSLVAGTRIISTSAIGLFSEGGGNFGDYFPANGTIYQSAGGDLSAVEFTALVELPS